ncbi:prolyl oligopeptidase family serine peptidase [Paenibacillus sp. HJL G12]|uniref:Prolyl oligopeptidase family serine peptidase n=1 Tax=Paenibacillus dendrobii TaxID=2691084 RepID=A0A7X3LHZ4_9BACL|nr:S9 family peptidase [Paenibacillus dendrobii]MWV45592.1 prolyl oligopeptidase family serine peptidase [Paenibacillus dendrobii]
MSEKRVMTAEDLHRMQWVSDPAVSPEDGSTAYILKSVNSKNDGYVTQIRLIDPDGSADVPFTAGEQDGAPHWSPDGSQLAFLRKKGEARQVWLLPARGGEAQAVTDLKHGVSAFKWSPDGAALLLKAEAPDGTEEPVDSKDKDKLPEEKIVDRIRYKADGIGLMDSRRTHLYVFDIAARSCKQITSGAFDVGAFGWSPDGARIAYTTELPTDDVTDADLRSTNDLYVTDREGSAPRLLTDGKISIGHVSYTPDGESILMLADDLSCGYATLTRIYLIPADGGNYHALYTDLDIQLGHSAVSDMRSGAGTPPVYSSDQRSVYIQVSQNGRVEVARFALDGSDYEIMAGGDREIYQFALAPDGDLVIAAADPLHPGDLFRMDSSSGQETRLTDCNAGLWSELLLSEPEEFRFTTGDGWPMQGWIMKPIGFKEGTKVPAVLEIHGGPQAMYGHTFMHEFQLLAAAGFAVFYTNPRGGHGYGQVHVNTVRGDYGGRDYQDLMDFTDYVLNAFEYVDGSRLGVTGGSYGGFMTNWIVGHTDRFQAAVTQRSISNWLSFYGVSDIGYHFTEDQIWGNPWDDVEKLWKHSPLAYVKNVNTPLLVLHGEQDMRCPIEQGEQMFIALKRLGKKAQLIRFPGADHNLSRSGNPHLRTRRLSHIVRWFEENIER